MTPDFRHIDTSKFANIPLPSSLGRPPKLEWLAIADLVIDPEYQREIGATGRKNVVKIATEFDWTKFAPVIVAAAGSNKFAIVDGQHRTTAAAICGAQKVPCAIIDAARAGQAAAFAAINTVVTEMSPLQIHAAKLAAGDEEARGLQAICEIANVEILRYPIASNMQTKPGQTMAVGCLKNCLKVYGRQTLITALQCITETENNIPGLLLATVIRALCDLLNRRKDWRDLGGALLEAFDLIDVGNEIECLRGQPRPKMMSFAQMLSARLETVVAAELKVAA